MTYPATRSAAVRQDLDRRSWPDTVVVVSTFDTVGSGSARSGVIEFGAVFEDPPFFSYGVELIEGNELVDGDYPFVTAGVIEWTLTVSDDPYATQYYTGADIWVRISSTTQYPLRWRLAFEGVAMKNVEHFKGTA